MTPNAKERSQMLRGNSYLVGNAGYAAIEHSPGHDFPLGPPDRLQGIAAIGGKDQISSTVIE